MADAVPSRGPEKDLVDQALERIDHVGQRPGFLVRTGVAKQGIGSLGLSTTVGLVLLVVLLLAALAAAIAVGGRLFEIEPGAVDAREGRPVTGARLEAGRRTTTDSGRPGQPSTICCFRRGLRPDGLGRRALAGGYPSSRLADGRVLIGGGEGSTPQRATIWDPSIGTVAKAGMMLKDRSGPATVLLRDGRVLVIGGEFTKPDATGISRPAPSTAEISTPRPARS